MTNRKALKELVERLTKEEFADVAFDFKVVHDQFVDGQTRGERERLLITHVEGHDDRCRQLIDSVRALHAVFVDTLMSELQQAAPVRGESALPSENAAAKIAVSKLPRTGEYLVGRDNELAILDEAWTNPKTRVVQIVAPGGVGKTQLVKQWRQRLLDQDNHGAVRVYDWSFYSQGTQQQASADEFFYKALRWFGDNTPENYTDSWAKGERLAELIREQRTLLILDGLEPLQHPPGPLHGELADPSLQSLLRGLGEFNPGLCVVTTRESVPDLAAICEPQRRTIDLTMLRETDGAQLLQLYGVHGSDEELRQASRDYGGHSLALILLGTFVKEWLDSDIRRKDEVELLRGRDRETVHVNNVMSAYVAWFDNEPPHKNLTEDDRQINRAAVSILHLMGLFNRPADAGCLNALQAEPPIPGLTASLFAWDDRNDGKDNDELWQQAVIRLRKAHLLAVDPSTENQKPNTENSLDAHPLVREHFAQQLATQHQSSSVEAHRRLYEHLKQSAPEQLDNLNDMMPLYYAVWHGCKASLYLAALNLFNLKISQASQFHVTRRFGAVMTDLSVISGFFRRRWTEPVTSLKLEDTGDLLNIAGFRLWTVGEYDSALPLLTRAMEISVDSGNWEQAAIQAGNLSRYYRSQGSVSEALSHAVRGVQLADKSGVAFQQMSLRVRHANSIFQTGNLDDAERLFLESERYCGESELVEMPGQPKLGCLFSLWGYRFCEFLIETGRLNEAEDRAKRTLSWAQQNKFTLDVALDQLTIGRSRTRQIQMGKAVDPRGVKQVLDAAVTGLRSSGYVDCVPPAYFARANFYQLSAQRENSEREVKFALHAAARDLDEARLIIEKYHLRLHAVDLYLAQVHHNISSIRRAASNESGLRSGVSPPVRCFRTRKLTLPLTNSLNYDRVEYIMLGRDASVAATLQMLADAQQLIDDTGYKLRNYEVLACQEALKELC